MTFKNIFEKNFALDASNGFGQSLLKKQQKKELHEKTLSHFTVTNNKNKKKILKII